VKILLTEIAGKCGQFSCSEALDTSLYDFEMQSLAEAGLLIRQQNEDTYILSGTLRVLVKTACDRCAKEILLSVNREFRYVLRIGKELECTTERQCSDEDCEMLYLEEAALDSKTILAEQLLLAIPRQRLCDQACKGICKECGCNLNKKKCQCGESNADSPFAILKTLGTGAK